MISLKQLHYALAVEKTLHFKKAADNCHVSQSTLSTAVHELEKQLGVTIFERNNKHVFITDEGKLILEKAKRIKLEVDELTLLAKSNKAPLASPMTIGVIPTIGPFLLPKVLPKVRTEYSDFKLKIVEDQSHVLVEKLREGELDAAILALPYDIDGLMAFNFWQEDFYWVSHKDECALNLREITTNEFDLDKLMLLKDGHCLKEHALAACKLENTNNDNQLDSTSLHTLIQMVAGKLGTTLVPQMALDQLVKNEGELAAVHLNEPGPHRTIALVVRPNYVRTSDIVLLQQLFENELKDKCYAG
ncbi:hydrogen peroxide-inducible genes activator [Pseudoalteromonas sp. MMG024]|uniref:hydrogen peroxide-inducible genes activator n=1 Tax=Pseudoalteromonas sp. MMG024 TaxID=2909980 RepID=UPI001F1DD683|nr:hydrogen peroxide-inducible genes activator [Pseudoalteromonas sp. MMG024]MCF6457420.1 hydrogen peroxide-inducible genes activator [Pseudoalteromonas sp. MMG024]